MKVVLRANVAPLETKQIRLDPKWSLWNDHQMAIVVLISVKPLD
jgi:hypothetical protein